MAIIGIDLGTTNSLGCVWKGGEAVLIPDINTGDFLTPSIVSIDEDGTLLVGRAAKECLISRPEQTISKFKRFMGTDEKFKIGKVKYSAEQLSALVLKKIKQDAESFLGEPVEEAIVSVPAYFNDSQRIATKRAGQLAGLKVDRLVNEPSSAALACHITEEQKDTMFLVIDFGGGTLDVSLVECFGQVINVLAVSGDNQLGGIDFDEAIAREFCRVNHIDFDALNLQEQRIILNQAEKFKFDLTDNEEGEMIVNYNGRLYTMNMSREGLIAASSEVFQRFVKPIGRVLVDGEIEKDEIDNVIMVGGSCKMPVIEMYIKHVLEMSPIYVGSPDNIVALGAGIYAAMKERNSELAEMVLTDICPFSLGVGTYNEEKISRDIMAVIIGRNSPLPSSRTDSFYNVKTNQRLVRFKIYQGEGYYGDQNLKIGEIMVTVSPKPVGEEVVNVTFTYDINGILEVWVEVPSKGTKSRAIIKGQNNNMSDAEVEARLAEIEKLTILPRDKEENRVIIEAAESLFAQSSGDMKEIIGFELRNFIHQINGNSQIKANNARLRMNAIIEKVEYLLNADLNLDEISTGNWYENMKKEMEKDNDGHLEDTWNKADDRNKLN